MKLIHVRDLPLGLYRVYWKDGGSSLAAVGQRSNGDKWLAPTNWITPGGPESWHLVESVVRVASCGSVDRASA